ncbi:PilZ domain-containing protein [Desulfobulbus alkaliphilus]|uniref:PilZ domain-containing protein n=1 Tax=Desulfobulbus alkaliphilus TaxID=869814 RepID=UPI0019648B5C|nr:PilZ domain-containing protein [Desulfobulbus alkaliphilus]MBM9537392.1 PilZ domain-containing protein [Desulfobulbus alkaliphilus]
MPSLNSFLANIKDGTVARVTVPLIGVAEKERLNCVYEKTEPPKFHLIFPCGILAIDQVDTSRTCMLTVDAAQQSIALSAGISAIKDPQTLELVALDTVAYDQTRNFFRVDATTRVAASSLIPPEMAKNGEDWRLLGDTIDLSGSGLLCSFPEPLEAGKQVRIELTLPTGEVEVIRALGHVVRCRKINDQMYHVALHFDLIDSESQDKIMACCFELQRRYLRLRVRVQNVRV